MINGPRMTMMQLLEVNLLKFIEAYLSLNEFQQVLIEMELNNHPEKKKTIFDYLYQLDEGQSKMVRAFEQKSLSAGTELERKMWRQRKEHVEKLTRKQLFDFDQSLGSSFKELPAPQASKPTRRFTI